MNTTQLESIRKRAMLFNVLGALVFVFFFLFFLFGMFNFQYISILPFIFIFALPGIILLIMGSRLGNQYRLHVKNDLVLSLIKERYTNTRFDPHGSMDQRFLRSIDLIPSGDTYRFNDFLSATFNDVRFSLVDVHITTTTSTGKSTTTVTNFKGQVYQFDFPKSFRSTIQIQNDSFFNFKLFSKLKKIDLEDSDFNANFDVFTDNAHEAFYILTPHFMRTISQFVARFGTKVNLVFHNSHLYIAAYSNRDQFEPSLSKPVDEAFIQSVKQELQIIEHIINTLKLDEDIFKTN